MQETTQLVPLFQTEFDTVARLAAVNKQRNAITLSFVDDENALLKLVNDDYSSARAGGVIELLRKIALSEPGGMYRLDWQGHVITVTADQQGYTRVMVDDNEMLNDRTSGHEFLYIFDGEWMRAIIRDYQAKLAAKDSEAWRAGLLKREQAAQRIMKPY
jgi:hypothetical protein